VAARLTGDLHVTAEIIEGRRGEFTVWVGDRKVAEKTRSQFPSDDEIVEAARRAIRAELTEKKPPRPNDGLTNREAGSGLARARGLPWRS
jgi:hypothetical protein